jgi:hypothetical protein
VGVQPSESRCGYMRPMERLVSNPLVPALPSEEFPGFCSWSFT